ncbi:MAG: hypothetical protein WC477_05970 [Patescibacteria group bacterium]
MTVPADIILGDGIFAIGSTTTSMTDVALTRGGGVFGVKREYRKIEADGDNGPVKERIRLVRSEPFLTMKNLEIVPGSFDDYFPSISAVVTSGSTSSTVTGAGLTSNITSTDYNFVTWTGYNKAGRRVYIELQNAINLENINWQLLDKNEIINELTFQGCYLATARNTEPWKIIFTTTSS